MRLAVIQNLFDGKHVWLRLWNGIIKSIQMGNPQAAGATLRCLPTHFLKSQQWLWEVSESFKLLNQYLLPFTNLAAGLLSPPQHAWVLARGTGGCSISAASGSASSSSRPAHSPTTRGRNTEPPRFYKSNGKGKGERWRWTLDKATGLICSCLVLFLLISSNHTHWNTSAS